MATSNDGNLGNKRLQNARALSINGQRKYIFATKNCPFHSQTSIDAPESLLVGTVADLLEEIKKLSWKISKNKETKAESISLFQALLSHYYPLIGLNYNDVINLFIYDSCKENRVLDLPPEGIRSWWPR